MKKQFFSIDATEVEVLVKASGSNANRAIALAELNSALAGLEALSGLADRAQNVTFATAIATINSQISLLETAISAANGSATSFYEQPFAAADLSIAGVLPITHGFGGYPSATAIYKPDGDSIDPDDVKNPTVNTTAVYLESFLPLQTGIWTVSLTK